MALSSAPADEVEMAKLGDVSIPSFRSECAAIWQICFTIGGKYTMTVLTTNLTCNVAIFSYQVHFLQQCASSDHIVRMEVMSRISSSPIVTTKLPSSLQHLPTSAQRKASRRHYYSASGIISMIVSSLLAARESFLMNSKGFCAALPD